MRFHKNIILVVIFITLGLYVYFFESAPQGEAETEEEAQMVWEFEPETVKEIVLTTQKGTVSLNKTDNKWHVVSSVNAEVPSDKIDSLFSVFKFPIISVISDNPTDLKEYGLDNPKVEFGMRIDGEDHFRTLQLGDSAPRGINIYARIKDKPEVFLLGLLYELELNRDRNYFIK